MPQILIVAALVTALAAIASDWRETHPPLFKLLKPLTTGLIIAFAWQAPDGEYRTLLLIALACSLLGDIALTSDSDPSFIIGLASFLVAHLLFMLAFLDGVRDFYLPLWSLPILVFGIALFSVLLPRAPKPLRIPVLVYGLVLCAMAVTALLRWEVLAGDTGRYALTGALLFVVSDSALGARRFVGAYPAAQALILSTYWAAIGCIAYSAFNAVSRIAPL